MTRVIMLKSTIFSKLINTSIREVNRIVVHTEICVYSISSIAIALKINSDIVCCLNFIQLLHK